MERGSDLDGGEEEDAVELSLGLSIGGGREWLAPFQSLEVDGDRGAPGADERSRLEVHAQRRHEARRKLEEKQQRKRCNGGASDRAGLEAEGTQARSRAMDRAATEAEAMWAQWNGRRSGGGGECRSENQSSGAHPHLKAFHTPPSPVLPMQYRYQPLQFLSDSNIYQCPYMMPCWAPAPPPLPWPAPPVMPAVVAEHDGVNHERNVGKMGPCQSFRPFRMQPDSPRGTPGCDSEQNDGSTEGSSSAVSDYLSTSLRAGGNNGNTRSHSSLSPLELTQTNVSPVQRTQGQAEHRGSNHRTESVQGPEVASDNPVLSTTQSNPRKPEKTTAVVEPLPITKIPSPQSPLRQTHMVLVDGVGDDEKPKPAESPMPQMPCVSTTGSGPNGKTITGFLYRYTKAEISIVCVCHGSSFSPEEFVKHAGGTDVSHPLKRIKVVPSAFA